MRFTYVVCLSKHNTRTMYLVEMHFLKSLLQMRFTLIVERVLKHETRDTSRNRSIRSLLHVYSPIKL